MKILVGLLLVTFAELASADLVVYDVTVNTSSLAGTTGSLDFTLSPGPSVTQPAMAQVAYLSSGGLPNGIDNCPVVYNPADQGNAAKGTGKSWLRDAQQGQ
jgi:hypothetical protein